MRESVGAPRHASTGYHCVLPVLYPHGTASNLSRLFRFGRQGRTATSSKIIYHYLRGECEPTPGPRGKYRHDQPGPCTCCLAALSRVHGLTLRSGNCLRAILRPSAQEAPVMDRRVSARASRRRCSCRAKIAGVHERKRKRQPVILRELDVLSKQAARTPKSLRAIRIPDPSTTATRQPPARQAQRFAASPDPFRRSFD